MVRFIAHLVVALVLFCSVTKLVKASFLSNVRNGVKSWVTPRPKTVEPPLATIIRKLHEAADEPVLAFDKRLYFRPSAGGKNKIQFIGVPFTRVQELATEACAADKFSIAEAFAVLESPYNEQQLLGVLLVEHHFARAVEQIKNPRRETYGNALHIQREIVARYPSLIPSRINNALVVDFAAPPLIGAYAVTNIVGLQDLYILAINKIAWKRRSAVMATQALVDVNDFRAIARISTQLARDPEDNVREAVGWMLRQAGERDEAFLIDHLEGYAKGMTTDVVSKAMEKLPAEFQEQMKRLAPSQPQPYLQAVKRPQRKTAK